MNVSAVQPGDMPVEEDLDDGAQEFRIVMSSKLRPSVLIIPEADGFSREYNFVRSSRDGTHYFTCQRCYYLNKQEPQATKYAVHVQEDDGVLYYSESVLHHPQCVPKKDSEIIVRGIERKYKDAVRQGEMKPYKAYKQATFEAALTLDSTASTCIRTWRKSHMVYKRANYTRRILQEEN